ncbi:MAG: uroporphyrinogen-III synthase [Actinomyces graevenitzii]|nr:uroporphyrinogen-III synthase [Actinomyces graevenitzii]
MVVSRETLAGLRVALPRLKSDDAIAAALKTAGAQVDTFALTQTILIESEQLEQMRQRLASGYYAWVVLSSWRAAQAVLPQLNSLALAPASAPTLNSPTSAPTPHSPTLALSSFALASEAATRESSTKQSLGRASQPDSIQQADSIQGATRLAAVGQSTADWVNTHCALKPTLVGAGSAAKLLEVFPTPPTATTVATPTSATAALMSPTILATPQQPAVTMPAAPATICLPQSQLAAPTLAQGLSQLGWQVDAVATYTTVPLPQLPAHLKTQWQAGAWDAVVVTAGSSAQALLQLLGPPPEKTAVVSIGQSTTARCRELGLRVDATAATPRAEHITQAIINLFKAKDFS